MWLAHGGLSVLISGVILRLGVCVPPWDMAVEVTKHTGQNDCEDLCFYCVCLCDTKV